MQEGAGSALDGGIAIICSRIATSVSWIQYPPGYWRLSAPVSWASAAHFPLALSIDDPVAIVQDSTAVAGTASHTSLIPQDQKRTTIMNFTKAFFGLTACLFAASL